jgi:hypothetical protein
MLPNSSVSRKSIPSNILRASVYAGGPLGDCAGDGYAYEGDSDIIFLSIFVVLIMQSLLMCKTVSYSIPSGLRLKSYK